MTAAARTVTTDAAAQPRQGPATPRSCSIARTLEVVGEKWSLLAIREAMLGVRRFDQIVANTGAPRDVLADRLRKLVDAGILDKVAYSHRPPRFEYHLTDAGLALQPVLLTLRHWGDEHVDGDGRPRAEWTHSCGAQFAPKLTCRACAEPVVPGSLTRTTD